MSRPGDDWDAEEHEALDGLADELAEIRRRHQDEPSVAMLRAAAQNALPPELQARVERHLETSAWSRAIVDGLKDTGAEVRIDAQAEERLLERIRRAIAAESRSKRQWPSRLVVGSFAMAATLVIAVVLPLLRPADVPIQEPATAPPASQTATPVTPVTPAPPVRIAYDKPPVKLSSSALTWRGATTTNPFLEALGPAFAAYRAGEYPAAVAEFDRLSTLYPGSIDVLFYLGVSRMLAGDDAAAIGPLEAAARIRSTTFADDVAWFLAVARQRSGATDTRPTLAALCNGRGPYATAACAAVEQLDPSTTSTPRQP